VRIVVRSSTRYRYTEPVVLEPHRLRLRPREGPALRLVRLAVDVRPGGALRWSLDPEGNDVATIWFEGTTSELAVTCETEVETSNIDPFDFLLDPGAVELPLRYGPAEARRLEPFRRRPAGGDVAAFADEVRARSGSGTVAFLTALVRAIPARIRTVRRERGGPRPGRWTLARGEGACRDTAVLFAEVCRAEGLAARFCSGWVAAVERSGPPDLHAWAEVYLPGAGWRGFDPSRGLAVDDAYVPLAASASAAGAAIVSGTYRGGARSRMTASVEIESSS